MSEVPANIFIVEDEAIVAFEMTDQLEDLGFEVVGPSLHLDDAEDLARTAEIDAAILDVNLGGGRTSEPVAKILDDRKIPYVFITAYDAAQTGFVDERHSLLRKPVRREALVNELKRLNLFRQAES